MKEAIKRGAVVAIGIILQFIISIFIYMFLIDKIFFINLLFSVLQICLIVALIKNNKNYSNTLPIIIIVLLFPVIGTLLCLVFAQNKKNSKVLKSIIKSDNDAKKYYVQEEDVKEILDSNSRLRYMTLYHKFLLSTNNDLEYYSLGEIAFSHMLEELNKAKKFIFIEYFIINEGIMWSKILEILKKKVKEGVLVRVIYDDAGCIATLNKDYDKYLESLGIHTVVFNKLNPLSGVILNNRDHRKIMVIDGVVAFTGGINISDEYINVGSPYGHWKDNAIKIKGSAVWSYTLMFLSIWNAFRYEDKDYKKYYHKFDFPKNKGIVVPYSESPLDDELTGKDIYLNIINQANKYVYIFTPYLIIDTDMINALILAAKRGVDVRIVIPGIPDKKIVYTLSESYLETLVKGGVKIYKYTPGFVHSKVFVSDDNIACVGTINLDYRSLYLHFECGVYLEKVKCINDIKEDLLNSIDKSHLVSKKEATPGFFKSIWQTILRLFAPLM